MKIARVITTFDCGRNCSYCCNKYQTLISQGREIDDIVDVMQYDQIILTGGEPMLYPERIIDICKRLREWDYKGPIWLYSAKYVPMMWEVMQHVDGLHFTMHTDSAADMDGFNLVQTLASTYRDKSFRLYISPSIVRAMTIYPFLWKRVEVKPWIPEGKCPLPLGEELFILKE
jgi:hypothetical protein